MEINLENSFYLFSMFIGFLVGIVLIFFGFEKNRFNILLGFNFLLLCYMSLIIWLITSELLVNFPFFYRTGNLAGFIFMPLMYFYIRIILTGRQLNWKDLIHIIPFLIFFIDFWPVLMLDDNEKLELIKSEISNPVLYTRFNQSRFFPPNFYTPFRSLVLAFYWVISANLVWRKVKKSDTTVFGKEWLIWIKIFLGLELLVFFPFLLVFWATDPMTNYKLVHVTIVLLTLGTGFSLVFFPKILYGMDLDFFEKQKVKVKPEKTENLSQQKIQEIREKLDQILTHEKKFLQHGYSIHTLAEDTNFPMYLLTQYINHHLKTNFSDLINQKRIEESCELIQSGKYKNLSLIGLAEKSGFGNRNSFTLSFQKFKNVSPSEYIKSNKVKP